MPAPKIGDILKWTRSDDPGNYSSVWRIVGPVAHGSCGRRNLDTLCYAPAVCVEDCADMTRPRIGKIHEVYFQDCTDVEAAGWQYVEDDFVRWIRQTREEERQHDTISG